MKLMSLAWRLGMVVAGLGSTVARATPEPHPTRANRFIETIDGIRLEYSPGQEALLQPIAERCVAWNREWAAQVARDAKASPAPLPLSARDLRIDRAAVLQQIAATIGLEAPTDLQGRCYDAMLEHYEMLEGVQRGMGVVLAELAQAREVAIWKKGELTRRLESGEKITGYTWNPKTGEGDYSFGFSFNQEPSPEQKAVAEKAARQRLDHSFNYKVGADGIATFSATFNFKPGQPTPPPSPTTGDIRWPGLAAGAIAKMAQPGNYCLPVVLSEEDAGRTPDEIAGMLVAQLKGFAEAAGEPARYRDGTLAFGVLHEATEAGIVERYIGSADRRWLCEGAANFVAWKIARDRAGAEFAPQVYNLDGQLAQYVALQPRINLRKWLAVEHTREADRDTPLTKAHYAFATRAVFALVQENGEDALPQILREVGRTPRAKVTMKTVAKAYQKVTGRRLEDLITAAEKNPLPPAPPGAAPAPPTVAPKP